MEAPTSKMLNATSIDIFNGTKHSMQIAQAPKYTAYGKGTKNDCYGVTLLVYGDVWKFRPEWKKPI